MDPAVLLKFFPFDNPHEPISLYKHAPVFRVRDRNGDWVIKRTGLAHSDGSSIGSWLCAIRNKGLGVVAPAKNFGENPRVLEDNCSWVVYPYIENAPYDATAQQIEMAGALLGSIHATRVPEERKLKTISDLIVHDREWIRLHTEQALNDMRHYAPQCLKIFEDYLQDRLSSLSNIENLPMAGCVVDFKASNLAYSPVPVLVDPDHAAYMPRLIDLANALLLFHCDLPNAPSRLWNLKEWKNFLVGYGQYVSLTSAEKKNWQRVLNSAWLNEGIWLLGNFLKDGQTQKKWHI